MAKRKSDEEGDSAFPRKREPPPFNTFDYSLHQHLDNPNVPSRGLTEEYLSFLEKKVERLEGIVYRLRKGLPEDQAEEHNSNAFESIADKEELAKAETVVQDYFKSMRISQEGIHTDQDRYILLSSVSMTVDFVEAFRQLYSDMDTDSAMKYAQGFLFDIAQIAGKSDASRLIKSYSSLDTFLAKMASGPLHFAFTGWASVEMVDMEQNLDNFHAIFVHHNSFEADSWLRCRGKQDRCVCAMGAGYSSGWVSICSALSLITVEIQCRARGDPRCLFIMAKPDTIQSHLDAFIKNRPDLFSAVPNDWALGLNIPFQFKKREDDLKAAMNKAEELNRIKSCFLTNMSHEMRTPLNGIIGVASAMLDEIGHRQDLDSEEQTEESVNLQLIMSSAKSLFKVITDILDYSRIDAGLMTLEFSPYCLAQMELHLFQFARTLLQESQKKVEPTLAFPDQLLYTPFQTDHLRLQQIMEAFISNAVKFMRPEGNEIEFGVRLEEAPPQAQQGARTRGRELRCLVFYVKDGGIGIEPSNQEIIFMPFQQVDMSTRRPYTGTGIGLPIARGLAQLLKGEIVVESALNHGSTFSFSLPFEEISLNKGAGPRHAVMIMPSPSLMHRFQVLFQEQGWGLTLVGNEKEAMEEAWKKDPSLILLDSRTTPLSLHFIEIVRRAYRARGRDCKIIGLVEGDQTDVPAPSQPFDLCIPLPLQREGVISATRLV